MPRKPRLIDMFIFDKPKPAPMSGRRRDALATDAKPMPASCIGEPLRIWGEVLALDERPKPCRQSITFDGAVPHPEN